MGGSTLLSDRIVKVKKNPPQKIDSRSIEVHCIQHQYFTEEVFLHTPTTRNLITRVPRE